MRITLRMNNLLSLFAGFAGCFPDRWLRSDLMQENRAFMEGELRTMAGWVDMPDR